MLYTLNEVLNFLTTYFSLNSLSLNSSQTYCPYIRK